MKIRRLLLPFISLLGVLIAIYLTFFLVKEIPNNPPEYPPPIPSYDYFVAGEGIVEAFSENIAIGVPYGEIISEVLVKEGDRVDKGTPLFRLDDRVRQLKVEEARGNLLEKLAEYTRQLELPRPEDIPPVEEEARIAYAEYQDQESQLHHYERVKDKRAISEDALNQRKHALDRALANYEAKRGRLELLLAGAWQFDLDIYQSRIEEAKAQLRIAEMDLERSVICAPVDGEVLQIRARVGQYAQTGDMKDPLMIFGQVNPLMLRVDIDETEAWRVQEGAAATAYVRGNSSMKFPIHFEKIEPLMVPKQNLSGDPMERVDTRVLQVLFSFDKEDRPIYVGQMLDVYIESHTSGKPVRGKVR